MTYKEYTRDSANLHRAYYRQYAGMEGLREWILERWSVEQIREAYEADRHLNNLPSPKVFNRGMRSLGLPWSYKSWMVEMITGRPSFDKELRRLAKKYGDFVSDSMFVCAVKQAMEDML